MFCEVLESLREQMALDKRCSEILAEVFNTDEFVLYDNTILIKKIIDVLSILVDKESLEHYVFDLNFGKPSSESEWETPQQFYKRAKNH